MKKKGILIAIFTNPIGLIAIGILIIIGIYMFSQMDAMLTKLAMSYTSLSARKINSYSDYDRVLEYLSVDESGNYSVVVMTKSEVQALLEEGSVNGINEGADSSDIAHEFTDAGNIDITDVKSGLYVALHEMGYPLEAICGIMGNAQAESGFVPGNIQNGSRLENDVGDNASNEAVLSSNYYPIQSGNAIGLFQWDGGRANNLITASSGAGIEWGTITAQMTYLASELHPTAGPERTRGVLPDENSEYYIFNFEKVYRSDSYNSDVEMFKAELETAETNEARNRLYVEWACYVWADRFERCGSASNSNCNWSTRYEYLDNRLDNALALYAEYGGTYE